MSKINVAASATSAFVEEDLMAAILDIIVAARAEILMFVVAMVSYAVMFKFKSRTLKKPKIMMKDFEEDDKDLASPKNVKSNKLSGGRNSAPSQNSSSHDIAKQINMIRSCGAEKNLQGALSVFEAMEQSGIDLNCIMYNTVLEACVECKDLKEAEAWMDRMKIAGMTDVVSFNTLMKGHLQNGSFEKARHLMKVMATQGLQPNQVTFNQLIHAMVCRGGDMRRRQLWDVIEEMKVAQVKPNQVTISILLKCLNSYSNPRDIEKTMDLIKSMEEPMDEVLLSSVVEACVRIGKPELLEAQLEHMQASTPITINGAHTYGSLIKAYGHTKDLTSVWRCWKEMRSRHIKPTSITLGCMVEAMVNNGDTEGAHDLIQQMQCDTHCQDVINSVIYCSLLKGFTREKKIDRVWVVYGEMKDTNQELSIITYNTLIDACARCGRMEHLSTIMEDMKVNGAKPNIITYSTMLKGHCQSGDVQSGFKILEQIRKDPELKPDEIMYNSLLDGCAQNNLINEGLRLLEEMQAEQVWPSNFTLSILVKLMSRARRLDQAFSLVDEITSKYNFRPNIHVYNNLVQACQFNQALPRGVNMLEEMVSKQISPDGRTYAILLRSSMSKGLFEQAVGLLRGALGLPDAPAALQSTVALCPALDSWLVNEILSGLVDRGRTNDLAIPLLQSIKQNAPKVRIDPVTQRKVMSPCVGSENSSPTQRHPWAKR